MKIYSVVCSALQDLLGEITVDGFVFEEPES